MIKITLTLPETIYQHAANLAVATHLDIGSIVTEALAITLPAFAEALTALAPPDSKEEVRIIVESQTTMIMRRLLHNDKSLRDRLQQWRADGISTHEITTLLSLLLMQQHGWLMESEAVTTPAT